MSLLTPLPSLGGSDSLSSLSSALEGVGSIGTSTGSAVASTPGGLDTIWAGITSGLNAALPGVNLGTVAAQGKEAGQSAASAFSWARVAAFVIGIIAIGSGLLMFRQTQVVIQSGARAAKRVGEIAAL